MARRSSSKEKQRYWERRLWELLGPIPINDLLAMSWAIEAYRSGRVKEALARSQFPGTVEEHQIGREFFIPPWNVDGLLNEALAADLSGYRDGKCLDLTTWGGKAKLLNAYQSLSNVEGVMDYKSGEIISAIPRLFWPQYDWQIGFTNAFRLGRAWFVYAHEEGGRAFQDRYAISLEKFLLASFAIFAATSDAPAVISGTLVRAEVTLEEIYRTRKVLGGRLDRQSAFAREIRENKLPRNFKRSAIREKPIIISTSLGNEIITVPSREYLMLRVTDGLYYDIVYDSDARRISGERFEELCRRMLSYYLDAAVEVKRGVKTSYGLSADILTHDTRIGGRIIFECKVRRIPNRVLTSPNPYRDFAEDFEDLIKGVTQIWRTTMDLYSEDPENVVGAVVLYDPWTVMGNSFIGELLGKAHERANNLEIDGEFRVPVSFVGYVDLERSVRKFAYNDVHKGVSELAAEERFGYQLEGVLESFGTERAKIERFNYSKLAAENIGWWEKLKEV